MRHLITIAIALCCVAAQSQTCRVPVTFENRDYEIAHDVEPAGLTVTLDGGRARVVSLTPNRQRLRVLVLLDVSGSMTSPRTKWLHTSNLVGHMRERLREHADLALATFSAEVELVIPFGLDQVAFAARLNDMIGDPRPGPEKKAVTGLWDAIGRAREMLHPAQPGDVIYAITDGGDNYSKTKPGQLMLELMKDRIRFFSFVLSEAGPPPMPPEEQRGPTTLLEHTRATGGDVAVLDLGHQYWGPAQEVLQRTDTAASVLYARITDFYWLEIEGARQPRKVRVDARSMDGQKRYAIAPRMMFPCEP